MAFKLCVLLVICCAKLFPTVICDGVICANRLGHYKHCKDVHEDPEKSCQSTNCDEEKSIDSTDYTSDVTSATVFYSSAYGAPTKQTEIDGRWFPEVNGLKKIVIRYQDIHRINSTELSGLINAEVLDLKYNNISLVENGGFDALKKLTELRLDFNYLSEVAPFGDLPVLKTLTLSGCMIKAINNDSFGRYPNLKTLRLDYNVIGSVDELAFCNLRHLTDLSLRYNKLAAFALHCFTSILENLDLSRNSISELNASNSSGQYHPMLHELNLYKNKITAIEECAFCAFVNLEKLSLGWNLLQEVNERMFNGIPKLLSLELQSNKLTTVASRTFSKVWRLKLLDLSMNKITSLEAGVFEGLSQLESLNLNANKFTYLSDGLMDQFKSMGKSLKINLRQNQWQCGCTREIGEKLGATVWYNGPDDWSCFGLDDQGTTCLKAGPQF